MFDEAYDMMNKFMISGKKWEKELKAYDDLDLADSKLTAHLPKIFSPEQISLLLSILIQLTQYTGKFPLSKDRMEEMEEMYRMIKDIRSNLHNILGDKN